MKPIRLTVNYMRRQGWRAELYCEGVANVIAFGACKDTAVREAVRVWRLERELYKEEGPAP